MSKRSSVAAVVVLFAAACSTEPAGDEPESVESTDSALKATGDGMSAASVEGVVVGVDSLPRPKGPRVPIGPGGGGTLDPGEPTPHCIPAVLEGNRPARTCSDLPGAVAEGTAFSVPAVGGTWKVTSLFPDAPAIVRDHACRYTWRAASNATCATPDRSVLLLQDGTEEARGMQLRSPGCLSTTSTCSSSSLPHLPGGGRCEVCGFVLGNQLYAVLPEYWPQFRYQLPGAPSQTMWATSNQVVVPLSSSYPASTVQLVEVTPY